MRDASVWDVPDDSTISFVAESAFREERVRKAAPYYFDAEAGARGRENARKARKVRIQK